MFYVLRFAFCDFALVLVFFILKFKGVLNFKPGAWVFDLLGVVCCWVSTRG